MKQIGIFLIFASGLFSCVPKSQYDEKEAEVLLLEQKVEELEEQLEQQNIQKQVCNEDFAVEQLKDYLSFYAPKCTFKSFKARMSGDCSFDIRMNKHFKSGEIVAVIVRLKFNDDGTYTISNIENDPVWACN